MFVFVCFFFVRLINLFVYLVVVCVWLFGCLVVWLFGCGDRK